MKYNVEKETLVCECNSGYTFIADVEDFDKLSKYNWFIHNGRMEGNFGWKGERVMLGRIIMGVTDKKQIVRQKVPGNDFRKSNLYVDNSYVKDGDSYIVIASGRSFRIDADDLELVQRYHWRKNVQGYAEALIDGKAVQMHRLIMGVGKFKSFDEVVDHINGDRTDNRKKNLRVVTQCENACNKTKKPPVNGTYGVYYDKHIKRWRGSYHHLGERYQTVLCDSSEEACKEMARLKECVETGTKYVRTSKRKKPSSGEKYIYRAKDKYSVSIKGRYLGVYNTILEGIAARDAYLQ